MRIAIDRSVFADAMKWVDQALAKNPAVPALACVPLRVADGKLILSAFDYEVSAQITLDVTSDDPGEGAALLSGRVLKQLAGALPREMVYLDLDESRGEVVLSCGTSQWNLAKVPAEDYPTPPSLPPAVGTVSGADFADAVARVAFATGADEALPTLAGVHVRMGTDSIAVFATDRFRIAHATIPWEPDRQHVTPGEVLSVTLPSRFIDQAAKQMGGEGKLSIALHAVAGDPSPAGMVGFDAGWRHITARPYDAVPPANLVKVMDAARPSIFVDVDSAALIEATKRVDLLLPEKMAMHVEAADGYLTVSARGDAYGSGRESLPVEIDGDGLEALVNPHYLIDALTAMRAATVRLGYNPAKRQFTFINPAADPDVPTAYRHVLMAIRPTATNS